MTNTIHLEQTHDPSLAREATTLITDTFGTVSAARPRTPSLSRVFADPTSIPVVALKAGTMVGCVIAVRANQHTYELLNLAVSKPYRGNGVGTQLLQDAMRIAQDQHGATAMVISSPDEHNAWLQRHGIQMLPADHSIGVLTRGGHIQVIRPNPRQEN